MQCDGVLSVWKNYKYEKTKWRAQAPILLQTERTHTQNVWREVRNPQQEKEGDRRERKEKRKEAKKGKKNRKGGGGKKEGGGDDGKKKKKACEKICMKRKEQAKRCYKWYIGIWVYVYTYTAVLMEPKAHINIM